MAGKNFCMAAKDAMSLVWCNADRYALVNGIGGMFIFVGKIFIAGGCTVWCYLVLEYVEPYKNEISSKILPMIVIFFIFFYFTIFFIDCFLSQLCY